MKSGTSESPLDRVFPRPGLAAWADQQNTPNRGLPGSPSSARPEGSQDRAYRLLDHCLHALAAHDPDRLAIHLHLDGSAFGRRDEERLAVARPPDLEPGRASSVVPHERCDIMP